jgi:hypothetical protein
MLTNRASVRILPEGPNLSATRFLRLLVDCGRARTPGNAQYLGGTLLSRRAPHHSHSPRTARPCPMVQLFSPSLVRAAISVHSKGRLLFFRGEPRGRGRADGKRSHSEVDVRKCSEADRLRRLADRKAAAHRWRCRIRCVPRLVCCNRATPSTDDRHLGATDRANRTTGRFEAEIPVRGCSPDRNAYFFG